MSLDEYCELAATGVYWQGALMDRCYVAPTQAFVLPDGSLHWCGAHAIRRPRPLANVLQNGLRETIRANLGPPGRVPQRVLHELRRRHLRHQPGHRARPEGAARHVVEGVRALDGLTRATRASSRR